MRLANVRTHCLASFHSYFCRGVSSSLSLRLLLVFDAASRVRSTSISSMSWACLDGTRRQPQTKRIHCPADVTVHAWTWTSWSSLLLPLDNDIAQSFWCWPSQLDRGLPVPGLIAVHSSCSPTRTLSLCALAGAAFSMTRAGRAWLLSCALFSCCLPPDLSSFEAYQ